MSPNLLNSWPDNAIGADEMLFEVIGDDIRDKQITAFDTVLGSELSFRIGNFISHRKLGIVAVEGLFQLRAFPLLQLRPDVAFISNERRRLHRIRRTSAWDVVPDLAVEIVSSTNLADEIDAKLVDYFAAGVRQVWVIYPETRRMYAYESLQTVRGHSEDDVIDAAPVLPGFTFRLADLFDAIENLDDDTP